MALHWVQGEMRHPQMRLKTLVGVDISHLSLPELLWWKCPRVQSWWIAHSSVSFSPVLFFPPFLQVLIPHKFWLSICFWRPHWDNKGTGGLQQQVVLESRSTKTHSLEARNGKGLGTQQWEKGNEGHGNSWWIAWNFNYVLKLFFMGQQKSDRWGQDYMTRGRVDIIPSWVFCASSPKLGPHFIPRFMPSEVWLTDFQPHTSNFTCCRIQSSYKWEPSLSRSTHPPSPPGCQGGSQTWALRCGTLVSEWEHQQ